jgi:hypothetical protein
MTAWRDLVSKIAGGIYRTPWGDTTVAALQGRQAQQGNVMLLSICKEPARCIRDDDLASLLLDGSHHQVGGRLVDRSRAAHSRAFMAFAIQGTRL